MTQHERQQVLLAAMYGGAFDEAFASFLRVLGRGVDGICLGSCCVGGKLDERRADQALRRAVEALVDGPTNRHEIEKLLGALQNWKRYGNVSSRL